VSTELKLDRLAGILAAIYTLEAKARNLAPSEPVSLRLSEAIERIARAVGTDTELLLVQAEQRGWITVDAVVARGGLFGGSGQSGRWLTIHPAVLSATQQRATPPNTRRGRPRKAERAGRDLVVSALAKHHVYEAGSVENYEPASLKQLAQATRLAKSTVSEVMAELFGKPGYKRYQAACAKRTIALLLCRFLGELPTELLDLLPEDYGGPTDDD